jgi:[protein-PII] uridylyltransferase
MTESGLKERLEEARQATSLIIADKPGLTVCRRFTGEVDALLRSHYRETLVRTGLKKALRGRLAVLALGGYGRRELCLYSDLDLLFVFPDALRPEEEEFVKAFLSPLWDVGVDLGYTIRTFDEALGVIGDDLNSTTALIDARLLTGDRALYERLMKTAYKRLRNPSTAKWYVESKLEESIRRHEKFGNSIYVLEPHVKEGCGGLRDTHTLLWLAFVVYGSPTMGILAKKGLMTPAEARALEKARGLLLDVRNAMHSLDNRRVDHLTFERQIKVARLLKFEPDVETLAEEKLMRAYYESARQVVRLCGRLALTLRRRAEGKEAGGGEKAVTRHLGGPFRAKGDVLEFAPVHRHRFREEPDLVFKTFALAAGLGLRVREEVREWIAAGMGKADETFRTSPVNRDLFLGILRGPANVFRTLHDMHECGALGAYLPEFERVRHLLRLDFYHQYTVDEHLLLTLKNAERLITGTGGQAPAEPLEYHPRQVARDIKRWDLLNLSLLLHDVGKGDGRGHVFRGAHLAEQAGNRMGLGERDRGICRQLILSHQRMSHLALRRNVEDPAVAQELARELGDRELLRMLYVMTVCDLRAVGPAVWNDWKAKLLMELYERTLGVLMEKGKPALRMKTASTSPSAEPILTALASLTPTRFSASEIERFLGGMPERYRLSTSPRDVARHFFLARQIQKDDPVQWHLEPVSNQNYSQLTVAAQDAPGMFSHICGALASRGANILAAQIYTAAGGVCLDIFQVQDQRGAPLEHGSWLERLRKKLNPIILGRQPAQWDADADARRARQIRAITTPERLAIRPTTVEFNNTASAHHTLVEVKTHDRPGLLYAITRVMAQERINIDLAFIATEGFRVVDVFYVTDWDNNKLEDGPRQEQLRKSLMTVLDADIAAASPSVPPASRHPHSPGAKNDPHRKGPIP